MMFYNTFKLLFIIYHLFSLLLSFVLSLYIVVGLIGTDILDTSKTETFLLLGGLTIYEYIVFSMMKRFSTDDDVTNIYMNLMYLLYICSLGFHVYNRYYEEVYDYKYSDYGFYTSCVLVGLISFFKKRKYIERRRLRNNLRDLERNEQEEGRRYEV